MSFIPHFFRQSSVAIPLLLLTIACSSPAYADERRESDTPFKIEDFSPKSGKFTVNTGIGYSVTNSENLDVGIILTPLNHGIAILQPTIQLKNEKRHTLMTHLGLRYGLTKRLNLSLRLSGEAIHRRIRENNTSRQEHDAQLRSIAAGADYRLTTTFDNPFMLVFAETNLIENGGDETVYCKTTTIGLSSHWAFDPVILSLTGTYSHLLPRNADDKHFDPGDLLSIAASLGLAITPEINANWGISQTFRSADKIDGVKGSWDSSSAFTLGYTQRLSPTVVMNINIHSGIAGYDTVQVMTNFIWRL